MTAPDPVRLDQAAEFYPEISRSELLELYRIIVEEYRFQVRLNWDRTQYSFVLNSALTALGVTVLATRAANPILAICVFVLGAVASWLGRGVVRTGHQYYRCVIHRKTLVEDLLGRLHLLPLYGHTDAGLNLATTDGMRKEREILDKTHEYLSKRTRPGTITGQMLTVLWAFTFVDVAGAAVAVFRLAG